MMRIKAHNIAVDIAIDEFVFGGCLGKVACCDGL
jgi:hypothetical protein